MDYIIVQNICYLILSCSSDRSVLSTLYSIIYPYPNGFINKPCDLFWKLRSELDPQSETLRVNVCFIPLPHATTLVTFKIGAQRKDEVEQSYLQLMTVV